jgi:hypothetical protein
MTRFPQVPGLAIVAGCAALLAACAGGGGTTTGVGGATGAAGMTGGAGTPGAGGTTGAGVGGGTAGRAGAAGSSAGAGAGGGGPGGGGAGSAGRGGATGGAGRGGTTGSGGSGGSAGGGGSGGSGGTTGNAGRGGATGGGGRGGTTGSAGTNGCGATPSTGPVGTFKDPVTATTIAPPDPPGISLEDTDGKLVNAHGGGIIQVCDTFYLHGEYFLSTSTANDFNGFAMYSSKDLATWKNEGIVLPQQPSGELGPNRKGERPHIIRCPATGEFVLIAHAADTTYQVDKEAVYATSPTVNGTYAYKGILTNASGTQINHSDMSALTDGNTAYVITESGYVYTLSSDCHSWTTVNHYSQVNGTTGGVEAPTVFKAGSMYYWIGSDKTGWRANDCFYSTAPAMTGPWTYQGYLAPQGKLTWMTQSTWVIPIAGSQGTTYVYLGDHWYGNQDTSAPGKHNDLATYVFQPIVFTGAQIGLPTYQISWKLDVGAGTWTSN